ncbi:MAG: hypothetical protein ABI611_21955 [Solirubrobacteraceae bacterium]
MEQQLLVLLLPQRLERFHLEPQARALLRAPGAVAVDPARIPVGRIPAPVAAGLAVGQAKRMRLPGMPAAVAIFHPLQFYLAGAMLARHPAAELWYGEPEPADAAAHEQLHTAAAARAALTFPVTADLDITRLQLRMAELGIMTG